MRVLSVTLYEYELMPTRRPNYPNINIWTYYAPFPNQYEWAKPSPPYSIPSRSIVKQ